MDIQFFKFLLEGAVEHVLSFKKGEDKLETYHK